MSIEKMLSLHPNAATGPDQPLALAARHASLCALMCTSCADACVAEPMNMSQCIRTCLDCADVCATTARLAVRRMGANVAVLRGMLEGCIATCDGCAEECGRHEHEHFKLCATMCRECADNCRKALDNVQ